MGKIDYRTLSRQQRTKYKEEVLAVFHALGLSEQGEVLLLDMVAESEVVMFARRLEIASRLIVGQSFVEIAKDLRVGRSTIRTVDSWLEGKFDSYRRVLAPFLQEQLKETSSEGKPEGRWEMIAGKPSTLRWVRRKYPQHFFLFSALLNYPLVYPRTRRPRPLAQG